MVGDDEIVLPEPGLKLEAGYHSGNPPVPESRLLARVESLKAARDDHRRCLQLEAFGVFFQIDRVLRADVRTRGTGAVQEELTLLIIERDPAVKRRSVERTGTRARLEARIAVVALLRQHPQRIPDEPRPEMTIVALDLRDRGPKEPGNSVGRSNLVEHILQEAGSAALAPVRGLAAEMCHMPPKEGGLLHDGGLQP